MARTTLTVTTTAASGTVWPAMSAADAANGNQFTNDGRTGMIIANGGGAPITATITTNNTYNVGSTTYAVNDLTVVVATGTSKIVGPFDRTLFNSSGSVLVDWSNDTLVTVGVFSLGTS